MIYTIIRFMIKYRYVLLGLSAAILVFGAGVYIRGLQATVSAQKAEIDTLQDTVLDYEHEIGQCRNDKALTERVSNDYQSSIANLRRQLDRLRNNAHCVPIEPSSPASVPTDSGKQLSGRNGLQANWLYDFAGRAEQDRLTAKGCLDFMDQLYQSRGYND